MCLAIPGKVVDIKKDDVIVEYPGESRTVKNMGLKIKKGDYVIVQARMIIQKIPKDDAIDSLKAWKEAEH